MQKFMIFKSGEEIVREVLKKTKKATILKRRMKKMWAPMLHYNSTEAPSEGFLLFQPFLFNHASNFSNSYQLNIIALEKQ